MSDGDDYLGAARPRRSPEVRQRRLALSVAFTLILSLVALGTPVSAADPTNPCLLVSTYGELTTALATGCTDITLSNPVSVSGIVTIAGSGDKAEDTTITAPPNSPALIIAAAPGVTTDVTITNLAISGADDRKASGGAIGVQAGTSLTLDGVSIHDNYAGEGAGVYNAGTTTILNSVFYNNTADDKGGAVNNDGTLYVENSTLVKNKAQQGGAVSTAGPATFNFVTIVSNSSKNKIGSGTHLTGGTITLKNSIVANNYSGNSFYDCSGQTEVDHVVFSSTQGCQPSGTEGIDYKVVGQIVFPAAEVPQDNGGPTKTLALIDQDTTTATFEHPAYEFGDVCVPKDQRLVTRPSACSVGAYDLGLSLDITGFTTSTPSVEVGAVTVPLGNLPGATAAAEEFGSTASTQLSAIQLSAIQLSAIQLSAIQLSAITAQAAQLSAIQLSAIQLSAILTKSLQLSAIQLSAINLSDIQLSAISQYSADTTISDLLCDSNGSTDYCGIPLQALTLDDLIAAEPGITLADIDFGSTQLSAIQLSAILLVQLPMETIQLSAIDPTTDDNRVAWCNVLRLDPASAACLDLDLGQSLYDLTGTAYDTTDFNSTQLSAIQLSAIQLSAIAALSPTQLSAIQLSAIQLSAIDWASTQLSAIQLSAIQLSAIGWLSTQLSAIQLSEIDTLPAQLSAIQLSAIQLSAIGCTDPITCVEGVTLGALDAAGYLDGLTLSDLAEAGILDSATLGVLAEMGVFLDPALTVADLLQLFTEEPLASSDYSLADLLFALVPPTSIAWEDLGSDLSALPLADAADNTSTDRQGDGTKQPSFDYTVTLDIEGPQTSTVDVGLTLPDGFSFARPDGTVPDATVPYIRLDGSGNGSIQPSAFDAATTCLTSGDLTFLNLQLSAGTHTLEIPVWAGTTLGEFSADVTACANAGTQTTSAGPASTSIEVTEGAPVSSTIQSGDLELAQITSANAIHEYTFELSGRAQARIKLTNLSGDLDLELFGPPMQAPLRDTPQVGYGSLKDFVYGLIPGDDSLDANALNDLPVDPPAGETLYAVSAHRATTDEVIDTGALNPGTYTIRVSGYNGATVDDAFALRLRTTPLPDPTCTILQSWGTPTGSPSTPTGINTVFLYDSTTYGNATGLLDLIGDTRWKAEGIKAAAVAVDQYPSVATALNAWAASYCDPLAANDVVRAIGSAVLDPILTANPNLEYIVIVGDDRQIPSARMTDGTFVSNEAAHGLTLTDLDAIKAALVEGYYLSDKPYATPAGIAISNREFFVPTVAIGRLVGSPSDIQTLINDHLTNDGQLATGTGDAVVAGYDFLADGAQAAATALTPHFTVESGLISETWTNTDLTSAINTSPSLAVIEAHYDQSRLLPANENLAGTQTNLLDVNQYRALSSPPSFMLTPGCHSALWLYSITNWADTNSLLGNYGYGYGDSDTVALSEKLVELTAERLGSMTIGQAQRAATSAYLGGLYTITPYDLKVMEEFTLFGLPMARLATTATATAAPTLLAATTSAPEPTVFNDPYTGLAATSRSLDYGDLENLTADPSTWQTSGYDLLTVRGRAILPQQTVDVTSAGRQAAGVLITGLTSSIKSPFDPVIFNPVAGEQYTPGVTTTTGSTPTAGELTFPASIQSVVKRVLGDDGQWHDQVVVVPARHYTDTGSSQVEFFTNVQLQTIFRPDTWTGDTSVPTVEKTVGRYGNGVVYFNATIAPPQSGSTKRVLVLFRQEGSSGPWQTVDLASVDGTHWLGGAPPSPSDALGPFEYFLQGVDNDGDVFQATGKAINYDTVEPSLDQGVAITVTDHGTPAYGWYPGRAGDDVTATATSISPLCSYTLDGITHQLSGGSTTAPIGIDGDGGHLLQVFAGSDCGAPDKEGLLFVAIDGTGPVVQAFVQPSDPSDWGPKTVSIVAIDPFGSGVESIEYSTDNLTWNPYQGPILQATSATIYSRSTDFVGNVGYGDPITAQVDTTPPTLSASAYENGDTAAVYSESTWTNANSVTVTATAADTESGVVSVGINGQSTTSSVGVPTLSADATVSAEGTVTLPYSATDAQGNTASGSFTVRIDRTPPSVILDVPTSVTLGQEGSATYECNDAGDGYSPLTSCVVVVDGSPVGDPTSFSGTLTLSGDTVGSIHTISVIATDGAGNSYAASATYTVPYGICFLYDTTKEQPATGAIAIKLQICDSSGSNLSKASITVTAVGLADSSGDLTLQPQDSGQSNSSPTYDFRYDSKLKGYIYNLNQDPPLDPGSYVLTFTVEGTGGVLYEAPFLLK